MDTLEKYSAQIIEPRSAPFEVIPEPHTQGTSDLIRGVLRRWYIAALVFVVMCGLGIPAIWLSIEPLYSVTGAIRVAPIVTNILGGVADQGAY